VTPLPWYAGLGSTGTLAVQMVASVALRGWRSFWASPWPSRASLFLTGFIQVSLICASTWLISRGAVVAATVVGFGISLTWTWNVKKVAFGNNWDRIIYSSGAALGTFTGMVVARSLVS
jgi:hypothetical protein